MTLEKAIEILIDCFNNYDEIIMEGPMIDTNKKLVVKMVLVNVEEEEDT